jgi:hypothetical protein
MLALGARSDQRMPRTPGLRETPARWQGLPIPAQFCFRTISRTWVDAGDSRRAGLCFLCLLSSALRGKTSEFQNCDACEGLKPSCWTLACPHHHFSFSEGPQRVGTCPLCGWGLVSGHQGDDRVWIPNWPSKAAVLLPLHLPSNSR